MRRKILRWLGWVSLLAVMAVLLPLALFLGRVAWRESGDDLPVARAGYGDAGRLAEGRPVEVIAVAEDRAKAERQIAELVSAANRDGRKVTIAGASHSMGGHTLIDGGVVVDLRAMRQMALADDGVLAVGAGARWSEVIPFLDERGRAVNVMQSNNDFSVGGSLSVNCHGWQHDAPPIASTVKALRVMTAEGEIVRCSRTERAELFSQVLGGYGLFGVILEAELITVTNEFYRAESRRVRPDEYARVWRDVAGNPEVGMAYGRMSVAPASFLQEAVVVGLKRVEPEREKTRTLKARQDSNALKRVVFRGSVGSDYGKNLRWRLEKWFGETGAAAHSRNEIMHEPSAWFANRDPEATEILHEYFVPHARLAEFVEKIRPILRPTGRNEMATQMAGAWGAGGAHADLLNVTVRNVERDADTALAYAREPVFGLVMLFHQRRDAAAEKAMEALTQKLIEAALACGGTYYLPYRPHATREQFARAYPQAAEVFAEKRKQDPRGIFRNQFFEKYGHVK
jgi:FAD/FMN-containing dehydrogenase